MIKCIKEKWIIPIIAFGTFLLGGGFLNQQICFAEIVEGVAVYNGDAQKSREMALRDAMRTLLESKVGMYIRSNSEVDMGVLVVDKIMARSTGYVRINRVVSESIEGDVYVVRADLDADDTNIETKYKDDVAKAMAAALEPRVANVAVVDYGIDGSIRRDERAVNIVGQYLSDMGIQMVENEGVSQLLSHSLSPYPSELRRIARNDGDNEANSVLAGSLRDVNVNRDSSGYYKGVVEASFSLVGIQNGYANSYMEQFVGLGKTADEALFAARREAAATATEHLARAALKTMQFENRGGVNNLNTTVEIHGLWDRANQSAFFNSLLEGARCRITRAGFSANGAYKVKVIAQGWENLYELSQEIVSAATGNGLSLVPLESTTKIILQVQ
ncbi:hypothetical protein [Anaerovibrio lipolyticus]|jgi:hypothetical protein|uniref:hypothetical protein n=1 Tax=Anaerovibrio lipolyticus TaxID=82374 RepID=UPI0026E9BD34|nr:hypothetical protein [Anaerovibrio lipolyticus]MBE6105071.1 hypothetical protein [Anaerovibrio lipolyticus]